MNQLLVISRKEDTHSMDIGRKYLAGLRKMLKSGRSKHWDVSIVFQYIKSISSVVPLPQRAVKQKGIKEPDQCFRPTHTHTFSLWGGEREFATTH